MPTNDELDLARAKAITASLGYIPIADMDPRARERFFAAARAIRTADAAMGVVSVPGTTLNKAIRLLVRCHDRIHVMPRTTDTELATEIAAMAAMLAASPLREKPDAEN